MPEMKISELAGEMPVHRIPPENRTPPVNDFLERLKASGAESLTEPQPPHEYKGFNRETAKTFGEILRENSGKNEVNDFRSRISAVLGIPDVEERRKQLQIVDGEMAQRLNQLADDIKLKTGEGLEELYGDLHFLREEFLKGNVPERQPVAEPEKSEKPDKELSHTQLSVLYFLEQKHWEPHAALKNEVLRGEPDEKYIELITDAIFGWVSETINDWKYDRKENRTASWDNEPFYGPKTEFILREATQVTPSQTYDVTTLEGLLDNFDSLYTNPTLRERVKEMRARVFDEISQLEVMHNRGAAFRSLSNKETPDGLKETLNALRKKRKKEEPSFTPELGKFFLHPESKKFGEMTERERRINIGTEFVFRIFCSQSFKDHELVELGRYLNRAGFLPTVRKYVDKTDREYKEDFSCLPYYKKADKNKRRVLYDAIMADLTSLGITEESDRLLCISSGTSASIGFGVDMSLDWEESVKVVDGKPKLASTIVASQDAGPKIMFTAYLRSTHKDLEKKKPNLAISDYMGQAFAHYGREACFSFEDADGVVKRDSLVRITAKGRLRYIDWSSGTTSPDEQVYDQFSTYFTNIYETQAFCSDKSAPFSIGRTDTVAINDAKELEDLRRYLGIFPEEFLPELYEKVNRKLEGAPLLGKFYGSINYNVINYLAIHPYLEADGKTLTQNDLYVLTEKFFQKLLVDFRQYWMASVTTDIDTYPWDTIVRLRHLFSTKASLPGLSGAVNADIHKILFDNPNLVEVSPSKQRSPEYEKLKKDVNAVTREIKSYLKYGMFQEMILYLYMPMYRNNKEVVALMANTTDPNRYNRIIDSPDNADTKYTLSTPAGFPALHVRELDALLSAMREMFEHLAELSKDEPSEAEGPKDYRFGPGYDPRDPDVPVKKKKLLSYIQNKYKVADGQEYKDVHRETKKKGEDWQIRPDRDRPHTMQSVINLVSIFQHVRKKTKFR